MPNKTLAKEWLTKAYHDLSSAKVLYDANHFTDTIGITLQQAMEKSLKAILANENRKIKKTHDLIEVYKLTIDFIQFEESEIDLLDVATNYYSHSKYPVPHSSLPEREEIKEVLDFASKLFNRVCCILDINIKDLK